VNLAATTDPGAALAARQSMADELMAGALQALDLFLSDCLSLAVAALDGPVLLAAAPPEPFSLGAVRQRFTSRLGGFAWLAGSGLAEKVSGALTSVLGRRLPREQAVAELEKAAAPEQWQGQVEAAAQDRATLTFNQLQVALMAQISPAAQKRWVAVLDTHTRGTHRAADGQTVPAGGHFVVGGERLLYPRDPAGSPAETYNCRCVVVPG
jgi:hypothetical protein